MFYFCAVNQTTAAIPKTWMKPNEGISAGDVPQKVDEVGERINHPNVSDFQSF